MVADTGDIPVTVEKQFVTGIPEGKFGSGHGAPDKSAGAKAKHMTSHDAPGSRRRKKGGMGKAGRTVVRCFRKFSPASILRKARDCYVHTMGGCANNYGSYQGGYGAGVGSASFSSLPSTGSFRARELEARQFDETCLSPAFKQAFNESIYRRTGSTGTMADNDLFKKSFSDFESSTNPTMRRAYSEAAAYQRFPGNSRAAYMKGSPGWTPNRGAGAPLMFSIQEGPEHLRPSFRGGSQEPSIASSRLETPAESNRFSFRKEGGSTPPSQPVAHLKNVPEDFTGRLTPPRTPKSFTPPLTPKGNGTGAPEGLEGERTPPLSPKSFTPPLTPKGTGRPEGLTDRPTPPLTPAVSI